MRHVSCFRCCFSFPATDTVARSERGGCVCVCEHKCTRWVGDILSFRFFRFPPMLCVSPQKQGAIPAKGRGEVGEVCGGGGGGGGRQAAEVQIWWSYTLVLTSSMRLCARMDHRPAGRPTCCSCPGNTQQWSMGIHPHSGCLPSLLHRLFLSSISSFHLAPFLNKTWPPACCWCHGCHSNRSLAATSLWKLQWGQGKR